MPQTLMRYSGFFARTILEGAHRKVLVKKPQHGIYVRFIPGGPSANVGPQDDSFLIFLSLVRKVGLPKQ